MRIAVLPLIVAGQIVAGMALAGCGDVAVVDADLDAQVLALTPVDDTVLASTHLLGCIERGEGVACYTCEITQYDKAGKGIDTFIIHYRHEFIEGGGGYTLAKTTEQLRQKYTSEEPVLANAEAMFKDAGKWCKKRGRGVEHILKNEMEKVFGDGS